jgi:Ran GTPase-activating protein (RanGAP) involved in mRNA processing and transport
LAQTISTQPANASIHLRLESVSNGDMRLIVKHAVVEKQCSELWLYNAKINAQGALILSNTLHENTTLKKLYLNDNDIRDRGTYCLAQALAINNSTLEELYLARNGITSRGVQYLADMLSTNRTVTTLSLYGNRIDDLGITYLTHALTYKNTTLEYLYLSGNTLMTDASVPYWLDLFKHNRTLKNLHLFNCNLSDRSKERLRRAARTNESFTLYV